MPAIARTSVEQIKAALREHGGNVTAAAEQLGMATNNLRTRIENAGVDLRAFRDEAVARGDSARNLRVRSRQFELLRQASFDLSYLTRREYGPEKVFDEFMADAFEGWLAARLTVTEARS